MSILITIVLCVVMIGGLVGMMVCNKKQATNPNAQGIAMLLLLVVVASGGYLLYHTGFLGDIGIGKSETEKIRDIEEAIYASQGFKVAEYLKKEGLDGEKIIVFAEDGYETSPRTTALKQMLIESGLPEANITFDTILPPVPAQEGGMPGGGGPSMPTMMRMSPKDFDSAAKKHADSKIVITLVGIPMNGGEFISMIKNKANDKSQKLIILGSLANANAAKYGLLNGNTIVVVTPKKDANYDVTSLPSGQQDIFDLRYGFYTKDNASQLM